MSEPPPGQDLTERMIERLSEADALVSDGQAVFKGAAFGKHHRQVAARRNGREPGQSAALAEPVSGERGDDGSPTGLGGASVAKGEVRKPQVIVRAHAEVLIGVALGDGTGLETERRDLGGTTAYDETGAQVDPHATEPLPIVECPRERLRVAEMPHN